MKVTFLGTCSGSEPVPNRRHTSFVIEHQGGVYWFDAGESCSYTAHLLGIDLRAVQAIFISHVHMDHVGGLANLLWTMQKLNGPTVETQGVVVNRDSPWGLSGKTVPVFIPNVEVGRGVLEVLKGPSESLRSDFAIDMQPFGDGLIFQQDGLKVRALHNRHLGEPRNDKGWQSFSYRIDADGKSVVFSGDVADVSEPGPLLDGCDMFLMETGHHLAEDVCRYLTEEKKDVGKLGFVHHGRAMLADTAGELRKARAILAESASRTKVVPAGPPVRVANSGSALETEVFIAEDGMTVDV